MAYYSMTENTTLNVRSLILYISVLMVVCLITSCSRKLTFKESAIVPAAQGSVKYNKDKNGNYAIRLSVRHLAPPDRLVESQNTYVVWLKTERNGLKNLGQLQSSHGLVTKQLKSELRTVTTFEPRGFFISAERRADIGYPEGQVILKTD